MMRLPMKPLQLPTRQVTFLNLFSGTLAVAMSTSQVRGPRTYPRRGVTFAGKEMWLPTTSWGRFVAGAISSMPSTHVFDDRMQPGLKTSRSCAKNFFSAMFAKTASTTL